MIGSGEVDKRHFNRVPAHIPIEYRSLFVSPLKPSEGFIKDICQDGVNVVTSNFVASYNRIVVKIPLPLSARPIKAIAKVVWYKELPEQAKFSIGIQFIDMSHDDREEITMFLSRCTA